LGGDVVGTAVMMAFGLGDKRKKDPDPSAKRGRWGEGPLRRGEGTSAKGAIVGGGVVGLHFGNWVN